MSFNILYIEDEPRDRKKISEAIDKKNEELGFQRFRVILRESSDRVEKQDVLDSDVVLADIFFDEWDRLEEIVEKVEDFSKEEFYSLPIIAYTERGKKSLDRVIAFGSRIYQIWDKATADASYVAYRLNELANELPLVRSDLYLCREVRHLEGGPAWREHVLSMVKRYRMGQNEADQIEQPKNSINEIGDWIRAKDCRETWIEIIAAWEPLERAALRDTRGHARHLLNVFWLGYYLINHSVTKALFVGFSRNLSNKLAIDDKPDRLNNSWFVTGLFHDVGNCLEKGSSAIKAIQDVRQRLSNVADVPDIISGVQVSQEVVEKGSKILSTIEDAESGAAFVDAWERSCREESPDSGVIGALYMQEMCGDAEIFSEEAVRAIAIHNLIGRIHNDKRDIFSWQENPLVCLLIICDQFQTWDRERGDDSSSSWKSDMPSRAELLSIVIDKCDDVISVSIDIGYVAAKHVQEDDVLRDRVIANLQEILSKNPDKAVKKIKDWPFTLNMRFWLSGKKIPFERSYGG